MTKPSASTTKSKSPKSPSSNNSPTQLTSSLRSRSLAAKAQTLAPAPAPAPASTAQPHQPFGAKRVPPKSRPALQEAADAVAAETAADPVMGALCAVLPSSTTTKQARLIALLSSSSGASMAQMMALTGWLPHTVRGMLSGSLRKRLGLDVRHMLVDGVRVFRIVEGSAP